MSLIDRALQFDHAGDPAVTIRLRVKDDLNDIRVGGREVLIGVYEPEHDERTKGGIILPDATRKEFRWQGVTGLVLKMGPHAFATEKSADWFCDATGAPEPPKIGDWVMVDIKDTHSFLLVNQPCRLVGDVFIRAVVARPDLVA